MGNARRLIYQVAVGGSRPIWDRCMPTIRRYAQRVGADYYRQSSPMLRIAPLNSQRSENALRLGYLPIYEKENALGMLDEYDQIAVVDADVYAMPNAPSIFDAVPEGADFAAAVERDMPITQAYARKIAAYAKGQYRDPSWPFMNMGVMVLNRSLRRFCPESPGEFLRRKEFEPFVNGEGAYRWSTDQTLLNTWLHDCGANLHELDWRWNVLYGATLPHTLDEAHLVHFFLGDHLNSQDPEELLRTRDGRARV